MSCRFCHESLTSPLQIKWRLVAQFLGGILILCHYCYVLVAYFKEWKKRTRIQSQKWKEWYVQKIENLRFYPQNLKDGKSPRSHENQTRPNQLLSISLLYISPSLNSFHFLLPKRYGSSPEWKSPFSLLKRNSYRSFSLFIDTNIVEGKGSTIML